MDTQLPPTSALVILKRWNESPEKLIRQGEIVGWFETTLHECIMHTEITGWWNPNTVRQELENGHTVWSPFAEWKRA